jgi:hypothetical protein
VQRDASRDHPHSRVATSAHLPPRRPSPPTTIPEEAANACSSGCWDATRWGTVSRASWVESHGAKMQTGRRELKANALADKMTERWRRARVSRTTRWDMQQREPRDCANHRRRGTRPTPIGASRRPGPRRTHTRGSQVARTEHRTDARFYFRQLPQRLSPSGLPLIVPGRIWACERAERQVSVEPASHHRTSGGAPHRVTQSAARIGKRDRMLPVSPEGRPTTTRVSRASRTA